MQTFRGVWQSDISLPNQTEALVGASARFPAFVLPKNDRALSFAGMWSSGEFTLASDWTGGGIIQSGSPLLIYSSLVEFEFDFDFELN